MPPNKYDYQKPMLRTVLRLMVFIFAPIVTFWRVNSYLRSRQPESLDTDSHTHQAWSVSTHRQYDMDNTHSHRRLNVDEKMAHAHWPVWIENDNSHTHLLFMASDWWQTPNGDWVHKHPYGLDPETGKPIDAYIQHSHPEDIEHSQRRRQTDELRGR